jgi:hypothetical protein
MELEEVADSEEISAWELAELLDARREAGWEQARDEYDWL